MRPSNRIDLVKRVFLVLIAIGMTIACTAPAFGQLSATHSNTSKAGIHLQLDKTVYGRGETVWFNAYLFAQEGKPVGSTLQVELIKDDSLLKRVMYPIVLGVTNGQLQLSKEISSGWYQLRAWTDQSAVKPVCKGIYIIGRDVPDEKGKRSNLDSVRISFFPESGILIAGLEARVGFTATDQFGNPIPMNGVIRDEKGNEINSFATWDKGMGEFVFTPESTGRYHAEWSIAGQKHQLSLPAVQPAGTLLSLINHPEGFLFEIKQKGLDENEKGGWLVGTRNGQVVFKQALSKNQHSIQGVLKTKELNSGILNIDILNEQGRVLASRKVFVNNEEFRSPISIRTDTLSVQSKAKNKWWLQIPDSLQGTLSIAVTDADLDGGLLNHTSILSQVMLSTELPYTVYQPDWYFHTTRDSAEIGLDLLMLTQPARPLGADEELKSVSALNKKGFITVQGRAFLRGTRQPLANGRLMAVLSVHRMRNQVLFTETDKEGRFTIDSLLFFGSARIFFAEQRLKKSPRFIDIQLQGDSIPPILMTTQQQKDGLPYTGAEPTSLDPIWLKTYEDIIRKAEGLMLEEITIKTRAKSDLQKLQEEYTSGAFDTDAFVERMIDLVNNDEANAYPNIFEYLRFRVPGLQVVDPDYSRPPAALGSDLSNDPTKYRIFFRQMPSASSMGNIPMVIYLNEIETDPDILLTIPAADIALVKIFSSFTAAPGGGPGGALAIYTKKPELLRQTNGSAVTYSGYSSNGSFPSPNYDTDPTTRSKADGRVTLDWRPNIFITPGRTRIPIQFYNNDRTKRFRIRIEGLTTTGIPIFFEKIVE